MKKTGCHILSVSILFLGVTFLENTAVFAFQRSSLSSLIETAIQNNPEIKSARHRKESAKEKISEAQFLEDPQLVITQWDIPKNGNVGMADQTWIGIEQMFPYPGKRSLKKEIAISEWKIAEWEYEAKVWEVRTAIKSICYQLILLSKTIRLNQTHHALLSEFITAAQRRYITGQATQQDLFAAEIELAKLENSQSSLEHQVLSAKAAIRTLVNHLGDEHDLKQVETETWVYHPFLPTADTLKEIAQNHSPKLKSATLWVEKSKQIKVLTKKESRPDFMAGLHYENIHGGEDRWMAMGKVGLPWLFGEKYKVKSQVAKLAQEEADTNLSAIRNETLLEVTQLFHAIKATERQIENIQDRLIPLALQALEAARIGYRAGKTDFLIWINSERTLLDFQMEHTMKLAEFWQHIAKMEQVIGKEVTQ
jgi:outer membrane protein TolC